MVYSQSHQQQGIPMETENEIVISSAQGANVPSPRNETSQFIQLVERVVLSPDVDVDKLDRMLTMQERILERNARMQYDEAMVKLQSMLPEVEKTASTDKAKYAKFEHILSAIKPALLSCGFSITHRTVTGAETVTVTAILSHRAGHREETSLTLPVDKSGSKNSVQAIGSSVEYGRRYTMNSLLGIATKDADNDGRGNRGAQQPESEFITKTMISALRSLIKQAGSTEADFCKLARINDLGELAKTRYKAAVSNLQFTITKNKEAAQQ